MEHETQAATPLVDFQSPSIDEISLAKSNADSDLKTVVNNKQVAYASKGGKTAYKYADLAEITDHIRPVYSKNHLTFTQSLWFHDGQDVLVTTLSHKSGQYMRSLVRISWNVTGGPQAFGAAISYAKRYALAAMANVATSDEDTDGIVQETKSVTAATQITAWNVMAPDISSGENGILKACANEDQFKKELLTLFHLYKNPPAHEARTAEQLRHLVSVIKKHNDKTIDNCTKPNKKIIIEQYQRVLAALSVSGEKDATTSK